MIIQTYRPDHPSVMFSQSHDTQNFLQSELESRQELNYPPFARLACLKISGLHQNQVEQMAHDLAVELRPHGVSAVSLWPGLVQTERLLASGIEEVAGFKIADGETPEFVGRVVLGLVDDPLLPERSGHSFVGAELAVEYGVTEADVRAATEAKLV